MARRRSVVVDEASDDDALRRARSAWIRGHFEHRICGWPWPRYEEQSTGVELLERVAAEYAAAGIDLPMGSHLAGRPYLLPGET